ncbi:hypothetical protein ACFYWP_01855 [Actinacidiphila glaucinigra]|uniref:hypothetical protein n=1 Tax=Actinacidiphila glaucinigra TaxID=235986 RepID=UPI003692D7BC
MPLTGFELVLDEEIPDEREELYPGKVVKNGPHLLMVDADGVGLVHDFECQDSYGEVACEAAYAEDWYDIAWADDLPEGEYWTVVEWVTTHYGWYDPPETDAEIVPMYPEEVDADV